MFKLKSVKSMNKRLKFTGTSKLMRRQSNHSHLLSKKSQKRKSKLSKVVAVSVKKFNNCKFLLNQRS